MESAKIALFEDNKSLCETFPELLRVYGHEIIELATNMQEVPGVVDKLEHTDVDCIVAIVDGDLGNGHTDGPKIITMLRDRLQNVIIIGNSGRGAVDGSDHNAYKDVTQLMDIIDSIPEVEK